MSNVRISSAQLKKVRERFGERATAKKRRADKCPDGQCAVCGSYSCQKPWRYEFFVAGYRGVLVPIGQGHSWKDVWKYVDERMVNLEESTPGYDDCWTAFSDRPTPKEES